jgi:hypothetical protein
MAHEDRLSELKVTISSQGKLLKLPSANDDLRRRCADLILQATQSFLFSWEKSSTSATLPSGLIRDVFSLLLLELGPGDAQVRMWVVDTLPSLATTDGRQLLLDALPWFMAVEPEQKEEATEMILAVFREILTKDPKALLPIIGCLSTLPLSEQGRIEAWNVALASLPVVDESDLPVLVQSLLRNVTGNADAIKALQAIREETNLMESSDGHYGTDQIPLVSLMVLNALMDRTQGSLLSDAYSEILQQMTRQARNPTKTSGKESWSTTSFTLLDIMVLLSLYQDSNFKATIEKCVDDLLRAESFPFQCLDTLLTMIVQGHKPGQPSSLLQDRLLPSLQALVVYLLLAPVRINKPSVTLLGDTRHLVLGLHRRLDRNRQEELVRCMLHLSDESSQILSTEMFDEMARMKLRKREELRVKKESLNATIETVHDILKDIARSSPSTFSKFKYHLMERLTTESEVSAHAVSHVSELLAVLMEPSDRSHSGVDSTEVMILLQKLLFSSTSRQKINLSGSDHWNNDARITRGFILANQLLKSPSLSLKDKDCLYQWVHLLLLPSNRRTVDPLIGGQGLKFLLTWKQLHSNQESHKAVFNNVKMIMANTGLVQMLSHYSQNRNRGKKSVLVYSKIPGFYSSPNSSVGNGKKRELVLCIDSFLRIRGISSPQGWFAEVQWVFDLVSGYLELGRDQTGTASSSELQNARQRKSVGWTPDGWLEASIELPALSNSLAMLTGEEEEARLLGAFAFDLTSARKMVDKKATKEFVATLMKSKDGNEQNDLITGFLRFSSGVAIGAGLSIAVLKNAYEHFVSAGFGTRGKKLIQYQLMKILDLEKKTMLLLTIFESISDTLVRLVKAEPVGKNGKGQCSGSKKEVPPSDLTDCKPNLPAPGEDTRSSSIKPQLHKLKDDSDAAIKALTLINDFLFRSTDSLIGHGVIYESLTHSEDDDVLHRFLSSKELPVKLIHVANMVINLRLDALQHLNHNLGRKSQWQMLDRTNSHGDRSFTPSDVTYSKIMKMTSRLSLMVPKFRREHYTDGKEFEFALLNHLLVAYLSLCREHFVLHRDICLSSFARHFSVEIEPTGQAALIQNKDGHGQTLVHERTIQQILFHLHSCDDQLASNIFVDIMGLLALQDNVLVDVACDVCWRSLHTVYTMQSEDEAHTLPYSFLIATNAVICNKKRTIKSTKNTDPSTKALLASVVRASANSSKDYYESAMARNSLLILWALMIQHRCSEGRDYAFLSKLLDELENLLNSNFNRAHPGTRPSSGKKQSKGKKEINLYISSLPGLSNSTIGFFFEMSVHLTVATLAIAPHAKSEIGDDVTAPFQHLPAYLRLFGRLLDLFGTYVNEFHRRSGVLVINACHQILNLCHYHVIKCVDWRNAQPLLSPAERKLGKEDAGSIKYLDDLLKQVATDGVGRIASFCDRVKTGSQMGDTGGEPIDSGFESETWLYATHYRKIAGLMQSTEKTMLSLRSVASVHNLVPPKSNFKWSATTVSARNNGKSDVRDRGFHEISSKAATELSALQNYPKKKKLRVTPVLMEDDIGEAPEKKLCIPKEPDERGALYSLINSDEEMSEAGSDNHSNGNSSDGFGVAGGWGEEELSANDDASLTLETNSLFDNS